MSESNLARRAMLASLAISQWQGRKHDRAVTEEVRERHHASEDAGRYSKRLVGKEALEEVRQLADAARRYHVGRTLPWLDDGQRILPAKGFDAYSKAMREFREDFERAAHRFAVNYPVLVDAAQQRLKSMFCPDDYPEVSEIEGAFAFEVRIMPMPTAADFRADLSDGQAAQIREEIERNAAAALDGAMRDVWERIASTVGHMASKLSSYSPADPLRDKSASGVFRDSLVENVRELCGLLPGMNIAADPRLEALLKPIEALGDYDAKALRESTALRNDVAAAAQAIADQVGEYLA